MIGNVQHIYALLGHPVGHSLSPAMHNSAFRDKGLNCVYLALDVKPEQLESAIEGVRALGIQGLNVTIPHKLKVAKLLDYLDPVSEATGAVNTVINDNGTLKGYNTDVGGFKKALESTGVDPLGKQAVILGGGGAAMAVGFALAQDGAEITLVNRLARLNEVAEMADRLSAKSGKPVKTLSLNPDNLSVCLAGAEILVNATSIGMAPKTEESLVPRNLLRAGMVVFDLVYNPVQTRLLHDAWQAGATPLNGLEMLVWQGALAFELWTGLSAPVGVMRTEVLKLINTASSPTSSEAATGPGEVQAGKTSIALTGFMGSGKTTVAKIVARKTGKRLIELDKLIETNAGMTIPQIFASRGETGFREIEIETVKQIHQNPNQVISCGGGVVLNGINIDRLRCKAVIVYLNVQPNVIMQRMQNQDVEKPVLKNPNDPGEVTSLLTSRQPLYELHADIVIDSTELSPEQTAIEIMTRLKAYEGFY
jgi:shikimate dehydrogenase